MAEMRRLTNATPLRCEGSCTLKPSLRAGEGWMVETYQDDLCNCQTRVSRTGIVIVTLLCIIGLTIVVGIGVCLWVSQRKRGPSRAGRDSRGPNTYKKGPDAMSSTMRSEGIGAFYNQTQYPQNPLYIEERRSALDEPGPPGETDEEREVRLAGLVKALDAYAVDNVPQSITGGMVSVAVLILTAIYSGVVIYQYVHRSSEQVASIFWTLGAGPFPAKMTCMALDGCYLSNFHETAWATAAADAIDPTQLGCKFLAYQESYVYNITYSFNPNQGFSALYDATRTDKSLPAAYGLTIESVINCATCESGTALLGGPVGPGTFLLNYVVTNNNTAISDAGKQRLEWFTTILSDDGSILGGAGSTTCLALVHNSTNFANIVQTRMRINSLFTVVEISRPGGMLDVYGNIGGGYGLLLSGGSLVIAGVGLLASVYSYVRTKLEEPELQR